MDPTLIYGQYGAIACLVIAVVYLYRDNVKLRDAAMNLLKKYQDRDEEELKARREEERDARRQRREDK